MVHSSMYCFAEIHIESTNISKINGCETLVDWLKFILECYVDHSRGVMRVLAHFEKAPPCGQMRSDAVRCGWLAKPPPAIVRQSFSQILFLDFPNSIFRFAKNKSKFFPTPSESFPTTLPTEDTADHLAELFLACLCLSAIDFASPVELSSY